MAQPVNSVGTSSTAATSLSNAPANVMPSASTSASTKAAAPSDTFAASGRGTTETLNQISNDVAALSQTTTTAPTGTDNSIMGMLLNIVTAVIGLIAKLIGGQTGTVPGGGQGGTTTTNPGTIPGGGQGGTVQPNVPIALGQGASGQGSNTPWISQIHPAGDWQMNYTNGAANCGPAAMAMAVRTLKPNSYASYSDALLVSTLQAGMHTTAAGTSINAFVAEAQKYNLTSEVHGPKADLNWINQQLAMNKIVIANGDYNSLPGNTGAAAGHYIDVVGVDQAGNYMIRDPLSSSLTRLTPQELVNFINNNPVNGGYCVAIGNPANNGALKA